LTRSIITAIICLITLSYSLFAQTIIPGGEVYGTWTADGSPYLIEGEINVLEMHSLTITPGVEVIFQGFYEFFIEGILDASGVENDSILFTAADSSAGWGGITFLSQQEESSLTYCIIQHGRMGSITNHGGGITCSYSSPTIRHCSFRWNHVGAYGGAIYCFHSEAVILNCVFTHNSAGHGGGIHSLNSDPTITDCSFTDNWAADYGGGIYCYISNAVISGCTLTENSASNGGGIFCRAGSDATISNCVIRGNIAITGGAIHCNLSNPTFENCLIENNIAEEGGGIYCWVGSQPNILNCSIIGNSATLNGGAIVCEDSSGINVINSTIWDNSSLQIYPENLRVQYCDVQEGYAGNGNINADPLFISGLGGDYYLSQLIAGQAQQSPCVDAGNPSSAVIYGTTRTDGVQDQGIVDMGYHYSASVTYPDMQIILSYLSGSPVPAGGGNIYFDVYAENAGLTPLTFDAWLEIAYEGGTPTTVVQRHFVNYQPDWAINRPGIWYPVPGSYAAGNYTFIGKVGVHPAVAWDESGFPFVKSGTDYIAGFIPWAPDGVPNPFDKIQKGDARVVPTELVLLGAYPNPFNPTTTISYQLSALSFVNMTVYDISGRFAVELVKGWRDAGMHEVTFDASDLASGIYIYRMEAGEFVASGKMLLLK